MKTHQNASLHLKQRVVLSEKYAMGIYKVNLVVDTKYGEAITVKCKDLIRPPLGIFRQTLDKRAIARPDDLPGATRL